MRNLKKFTLILIYIVNPELLRNKTVLTKTKFTRNLPFWSATLREIDSNVEVFL